MKMLSMACAAIWVMTTFALADNSGNGNGNFNTGSFNGNGNGNFDVGGSHGNGNGNFNLGDGNGNGNNANGHGNFNIGSGNGNGPGLQLLCNNSAQRESLPPYLEQLCARWGK